MIEIKSLLEKLRAKVNKLSPTCTNVHVDRPLGSQDDERVKKLKADYIKVEQMLKTLREKAAKENNKADINTDNKSAETSNNNSEIYRGKSF